MGKTVPGQTAPKSMLKGWGLLYPAATALLFARVVSNTLSLEPTPTPLVFARELVSGGIIILFLFLATTYPIMTWLMWSAGIGHHWLIPESLAQTCGVWVCWNTHLIFYTSFMAAFLFFPSACPTYTSCVVEYLIFATFVPSCTVMGTATGKFYTTKMNRTWGWSQVQPGLALSLTQARAPRNRPAPVVQQLTLAATSAIPMFCLWGYYYVHHRQQLPPHLLLSLLWHAYTPTFLPQPEVTGAREVRPFSRNNQNCLSDSSTQRQTTIHESKPRTATRSSRFLDVSSLVKTFGHTSKA